MTFLHQAIRSFIAVILLALSTASYAESISIDEFEKAMAEGEVALVIDARSQGEYQQGHIEGSRLIPHNQVTSQLDSLAEYKDKKIVVYCRSGRRAGMAAETLREAGFSQVEELEGSFMGWQAANKPVEK